MLTVTQMLKNLGNTWYFERKMRTFQEKATRNPENLLVQVRIGDMLARLKRKQEAIRVYEEAAQKFIEQRLFAQAIALKKIIFRLDPPYDETEEKEVLSRLYEEFRIFREETPTHTEQSSAEREERQSLAPETNGAPFRPADMPQIAS